MSTTPAETAPRSPHSNLLMDGALMLGAALVFVTMFRKLGLGATLGYIVGGAIIGPQVLGLIGEADSIMAVSEIGIASCSSWSGSSCNPSRLWRLRKDIFGLGLIQVVVCGFALAALIHFTLDFSMEASIAIGLPLALSSTAQVLPMLRNTGQLNHPRGERAFSVLLFQDLSIVPMITIIAAMSRAPVDPTAPSGLAAGAVHRRRDRRPRSRRPLPSQSAVPAGRPARRARAVRRRRACSRSSPAPR